MEKIISISKKFKNLSDYNKHFLRFFLIISVVIILLEIFLFNYKSFVLMGKNYTEKYIPISQIDVTGLQKIKGSKNIYKSNDGSAILKVYDLDSEVGTIYFDIKFKNHDRAKLDINMLYNDATSANYRKDPGYIRIVNNLERSKYEVCSYSGKSQSLVFYLNSLGKSESFEINGITINKKVPFNFNILRVVILIIFLCFLYWLIKSPELKKAYNNSNKKHNRIMISILTVYCLLLVGVFFLYTAGGPSDIFTRQKGDQLNYELVESFKAGKVYILDKVPQKLLNLKNPYDYGQRIKTGDRFKWDHLLYNGRYYSYYGIAPVLLFFLPYNLITGLYFPTMYACLLFSIIGIFFLGLAYISIIKNWFKDIPLRLTASGLIILLFMTGTLFCVCRPMFYEAAESSAFMFFSIALYFLLSSEIFTQNKLKLYRLVLSSLFSGLAVLSRPTFALYTVAVCIWFFYGLFQHRKQNDGKNTVKYVIAVMLPLLILGLIQMTYNYLRFGSVFEFGIKYSITINDFTNTQFHLGLAMISIYNMLFTVPIIKSEFPFITFNYDSLGVNGFYFVEAATTMGTFWRALPNFSLLFAPKVLSKIEKGKKLKYFLILGIPCLIIPLTLILLTWESGYALRYNIDFAWQMLILALIIIFQFYRRKDNEEVKSIIEKIVIVSVIFCILSNMTLVFSYVPSSTNSPIECSKITEIYYTIAKAAAFWS